MNLDDEKNYAYLNQIWRECSNFRNHSSPEDAKGAVLTIAFLKFVYDLLRSDETNSDKQGHNLSDWAVNARQRSEIYRLWNGQPVQDIDRVLNEAARVIREVFPAFYDIHSAVDFTSQFSLGGGLERSQYLNSVVNSIANIKFAEPGVHDSINPFEFLLDKFASSVGPNQGIGHCPQGVAELLVWLVNPRRGERLLNPGCGTGDILVQCLKYLSDGDIYARERNARNRAICLMRLATHYAHKLRVDLGDQGQVDNDRYDIVISDMSAFWDIRDRGEPNRFPGIFSGIPPHKSIGALYSICANIDLLRKQHGRAALVVPHGPLFRQGAFREARRVMISENILDAVIGLPSGLLYNTTIPAAILVINMNRDINSPICFIDSSERYQEGRFRNSIRAEVESRSIINAYRNRETVNGYSKFVSPEEVVSNDYNLNTNVYIQKVGNDLKLADPERLANELDVLDRKIGEAVERRRVAFDQG